MTGELNNVQNSTVVKRKKNQPNPQNYTNSVKASSVSWTSRLELNLTIYDELELLCKNKSGLTVSDDQLYTCERVMGKCGVFIPSHSHQAIPIPITIPVKLA